MYGEQYGNVRIAVRALYNDLALYGWIRQPEVDHNLGRKILGWMSEHGMAPGAVLNRERPRGGTEMEAMDYFDIDV